MSDLYQALCETVKQVPAGRVASYGQIARLAGYPHHSRFVSKAMMASDEDLPWHRIVNAQGKSSLKYPLQQQQFDRLAEEGVESVAGKIDMQRYGWNPVLDGMLQDWIETE